MAKSRFQILGLIVIAAVVVVVVNAARAQMSHERLPRNPSKVQEMASSKKAPRCSIATIAGAWVFATDTLYSKDGMVDGNALGTFDVGNDGTFKGKHDWAGTGGFYAGISHVGTVMVNPDRTQNVTDLVFQFRRHLAAQGVGHGNMRRANGVCTRIILRAQWIYLP